MAGTFIKPKAYNKRFFINFGTSDAPDWAEVARGITSRGNNFSESSETYYPMDQRGTAEIETTSQSVSRTWSGFRVIGDKFQDKVFIDALYDLDKRNVEFVEFYDNDNIEGANGWKGIGNLTISDDGSGDTPNRETIGVGLNLIGKPTRGTASVSTGEDGTITLTFVEAETA